MRITLIVLAIAMALTIFISNILLNNWVVPEWITQATFTFPVAFLVTDLANRWYGAQKARLVMLIGFPIGVLMTIVLFANA